MTGDTGSKRKGGQAVGDLLRADESGLSRLLRQARKLDALDRVLDRLLEPGQAGMVRAASLREGRLCLVTPSAALATRLRLDSAALLRSLAASGVRGVSRIEVRTAPLPGDPRPARRRRQLPDAARESLERFAADSGDVEIHERLAGKHVRKP